MKYEEFKEYKIIEDKRNPFTTLYENECGDRFYIEPAFYTQLKGFKEHREKDYPRIIEAQNAYIQFLEEYLSKNEEYISALRAFYERLLQEFDEIEKLTREAADIVKEIRG